MKRNLEFKILTDLALAARGKVTKVGEGRSQAQPKDGAPLGSTASSDAGWVPTLRGGLAGPRPRVRSLGTRTEAT